MQHGDTDDYVELTRADREATRIASLAVVFENANGPVPNSTLRREFYGYCPSEEAARKAFQRDKQKLLLCGITLRPSKPSSGITGWEIDRDASYSEPGTISADDALTLDIALSPLAGDAAFPYSHDLRQALMKIDRSFSTQSPVRMTSEQPHNPATLRTLEDCLAHGHAASINYQRADGTTLSRTVGICGFFALRGSTYFVAEQLDTHPSPPAHSYNANRVVSAKELRGHPYTPPEDFDIHDFMRLPFQLGPSLYTAQFSLPGNMERVSAATMGRGTVSVDPASSLATWSVDVSNTSGAASWAIAYAMTPTSPATLVDAWSDLLESSARVLANTPSEPEGQTTAPRDTTPQVPKTSADLPPRKTPRRRGRAEGIDEVRQLVAMVGALSDRDAVVTIPSIQSRLGVSKNQAERMYTALMEVGTEQGSPLTLRSTDEGGLAVAFDHGTHGVPIRLTQNETIAINAGLDHLGIRQTDPIRQHITSSFGYKGLNTDVIRRVIGAEGQSTSGKTLLELSEAIANRDTLHFKYKGINDAEPRTRTVLPQSLRRADTAWYLDAYDLTRGSDRTFRLDRMSNLTRQAAGIPQQQQESVQSPTTSNPVRISDTDEDSSLTGQDSARSVSITFGDLHYAHLFQWPGLSRLEKAGDSWQGCIPFYGPHSMWLPRHIAACAGAVTTSDAEVTRLALRYVQSQLGTAHA